MRRRSSTPYAVVDYYISEKTAVPFTLHLLPGSHFIEGGGGTGVADFTVNPDGTVSYASALQGVLTGQGTSTLGVVGAAVTIDATALSASVPKVSVDGVLESTAAPFTLTLLPGAQDLESTSGTGVVDFAINDDGTVSYATSLASELSGQGTKTLVIKLLS